MAFVSFINGLPITFLFLGRLIAHLVITFFEYKYPLPPALLSMRHSYEPFLLLVPLLMEVPFLFSFFLVLASLFFQLLVFSRE